MTDAGGSLFSVAGKTALVTGGTSGIGRMMAEGLVKAGAAVTIVSRSEGTCAQVVDELRAHGSIRAIVADVTTDAGRAKVVAGFGNGPLHVLVNNAGLLEQQPIDTYGEALWDRALDLNLKAAFFLIQALLPPLRAAGRREDPARVINVSSGHGHRVSTFDHFGYTASKAGLNHLTRQLAQKLAAEHINVNAIAPGVFASQQTAGFAPDLVGRICAGIPQGRFGEADDIVGAVLFLSSRAGAYVTSAILPVDGGWAGIA